MKLTSRVPRVPRISPIALGLAAVLFCSQPYASGFQLRQDSVKGLGRANAGSGVAVDDASVVTGNPAAMSNLTRTTLQLDLAASERIESFRGGATDILLGNAITGGNGGDQHTARTFPAFAVVHPLGGAFDGFTVGASLSSPFGFKTQYDPGWVGRYHAIDSGLKTMDLTLSAAWAPTERLSFGAGVIEQRAEMTLSNAIDFGSLICGIADRRFCDPYYQSWTAQGSDGGVIVRARDSSLGWVAGVQWRPADRISIGLSHRSRIDHRLQGHADFTLPADVALWYDFGGGPTGVDDPTVVVALATPAVTTLSMRWDVSRRYRVMADIQQTGWGSARPLKVTSTQPLGPLNIDVYQYLGSTEAVGLKDSWYYALGGEWDMLSRLTLRAGIAEDQTPTNDQTRTARLPDNKAIVYSLGLSWRATPAFTLDAAYQRIDVDQARVETPQVSPYWFSRLSGNFNGHVDVLGIGAQYRF